MSRAGCRISQGRAPSRGATGPVRSLSTLRLATRSSPLALYQARLVADRLDGAALAAVGLESVELVLVETHPDRHLDRPISAFAGQGAFVAEVEQAILEGRADVAVHSAKDLPSENALSGLVLAAVPERADPRDALVGRALDELSAGALVATGAVRRRAQLAWRRPDLGFVELRGNIATRLSKVPPGGAVVVALAALDRLGLTGRLAEVLPVSTVLPQVGQGAIALRCREGDRRTLAALSLIDDPDAHRCLLAERALLACLGGGCEAPVGAYAQLVPSGRILIEALVASPDGHVVVRRRGEGDDPIKTGTELAEAMLEADGAGELVRLGAR